MPNLPRASPTEQPAKRRVIFLPSFCLFFLADTLDPSLPFAIPFSGMVISRSEQLRGQDSPPFAQTYLLPRGYVYD